MKWSEKRGLVVLISVTCKSAISMDPSTPLPGVRVIEVSTKPHDFTRPWWSDPPVGVTSRSET